MNALDQIGLEVVQCAACGSLRILDEPLDSSPDQASVDNYLEGGAGIETIADCLEQVEPTRVRRFLDVGCNYGFALDIGRFLHGWDVVGVEPSLSGVRGAEELGLDIRHEYLNDASDIGDGFDLILASEVLEHVPDPLGFLQMLSRRLGPAGTLVLTTPAAEIVSPGGAEADLLAALSPGYHVFLASRAGLDRLLRRAGFQSVQVVRRHGTLRAAASPGAGAPLRTDATGPRHRLLPYYASRAAASPAESALAGGMATRHLRLLVALGRFQDAEAALTRVREAFLARHGLDLDTPDALAARISPTGPAPCHLGGAAFAIGMLHLLHRADPAVAARYFALASRAIAAWLEVAGIADADAADLKFQAPVHRAFALSHVEPDAAAALALTLASCADPTVPAAKVTAPQCRVYVDLVVRGSHAAAARLEPIARGAAPLLAASETDDERVTGLDALYALGIAALHRQDPVAAHGLFEMCANLCSGRPEADAHAERLGAVARDHAARAAGMHARSVRLEGPDTKSPRIPLHHGIDVYWCDASGTFLEGWAHAEHHLVQRISVEIGNQRETVPVHARPDLAAFWPDAPAATMSGFTAYVRGTPHGGAALVLHTAPGDHRIPLSLPAHPLPVLGELPTSFDDSHMRRFVTAAPDGPVVTVGMRSASQKILDSRMELFAGRRVVNVDVHPGIGVDVVGDAHQLSGFLPHGHFAVAASASLLEHLAVPWLVAAEFARVLKVGGIAIHVVPWVFPTHAAPADYWRFSPEGLAQLFGPATGFEVIASGGCGAVVATPTPDWRERVLRMPTTPSASTAWIVARRVGGWSGDGIRWPYTAAEGERLAREYPVAGLTDRAWQRWSSP